MSTNQITDQVREILKRVKRAVSYGADLAGKTETTDSQSELAGRAFPILESAEEELKELLK